MSKILCIEDNSDLRTDLVEEIAEAGYDVLEACDGQEGLEMILEHKPDLVISDITMPRKNGWQLVADLRENHPEFDGLPVVYLTALSDEKDMSKGLDQGACGYFTKPVDYDQLLDKLEELL